MLNLSKVVRQLRNEREQTQAKLNQLNTALKVLGKVGTFGSRTVGKRATSKGRSRSYSLTAVVVVPGFGLTRVVFLRMLRQRASILPAPSRQTQVLAVFAETSG
jgi:hypothetical protein